MPKELRFKKEQYTVENFQEELQEILDNMVLYNPSIKSSKKDILKNTLEAKRKLVTMIRELLKENHLFGDGLSNKTKRELKNDLMLLKRNKRALHRELKKL